MKKEFFSRLFLITVLLTLCFQALAQVVLPTDPQAQIDWIKLMGELIANPKALSVSMIGALVLLVIVQAFKSKMFAGFFKKIPPKAQFVVITVLGQVYALVLHVTVLKDQNLSVALVGFFTSGGAVAVFNAFKLWFEKPKTA